MCKVYGYCRISRKEQSIDRQVRNITAEYPGAIIVKEAYTGTKVEGRTGFERLLKQVAEGDTIFIEKLEAEVDDAVPFDQVLTVVSDGNVTVGKPLVSGAKVTGKVLAQGKAKKILVFKYKAKSNYRRRQGHRQPFTKVAIEKIEA